MYPLLAYSPTHLSEKIRNPLSREQMIAGAIVTAKGGLDTALGVFSQTLIARASVGPPRPLRELALEIWTQEGKRAFLNGWAENLLSCWAKGSLRLGILAFVPQSLDRHIPEDLAVSKALITAGAVALADSVMAPLDGPRLTKALGKKVNWRQVGTMTRRILATTVAEKSMGSFTFTMGVLLVPKLERARLGVTSLPLSSCVGISLLNGTALVLATKPFKTIVAVKLHQSTPQKALEVLQELVKTRGIRGLYAGTVPSVCHYGVQSLVTLIALQWIEGLK